MRISFYFLASGLSEPLTLTLSVFQVLFELRNLLPRLILGFIELDSPVFPEFCGSFLELLRMIAVCVTQLLVLFLCHSVQLLLQLLLCRSDAVQLIARQLQQLVVIFL